MTQSKPRQPVIPGSTGTYAVLPLRDIVVFPHMIVPLFVGREKSIRALEEVVKGDRHILLATQIDATDDDPATDAIYKVGTLANVLQLLKLPDGTVKVLVEGASRAQVKAYTRSDEYYEAEAEVLPDSLGDQIEAEALARSVVSEFENYVKLNKKVSPEVVSAVTQIEEPAKLADTIAKTKFSKEAREKALGELKKLRQLSPMSAEATVVRNYLDWMLGIPWGKRSKIKKDLAGAQEILDNDHYGLEKVKDRIVEYLAVQQRANKLTGPILCLVGPPGVGKTSLGKSVARATGREFVRMSLGGVRDEAEIRGHRRTYIGSMPGKIIQSMRKAKTSNPLILLDEIDKMGMDFRGDPSAALLEVLDPEQNNSFNDHYLEVDYDLSNVMFVTTANTLNIPPPLLDRMEVIRIAGYTEEEKAEIARVHLIPSALKKHGIDTKEWSISDEGLLMLVRRYTREAGVRNLERELANLIRKAVKEILISGVKVVEVTPENLPDFLGPPRFRFGEVEAEDMVGAVTGLAWTEVGGELLTIEGIMMPGKGKMTVTGNLRDVMKESISAAASYVRSRAVDFGVEPPLFDRRDIHVHVPEGATPKDGPSAGIAMATAIVSVITSIPVRRDIAMTGEVTLRGRVLPIGGLKEKLLAALRGGIKKVLIPEENAKDLADIPASVKNGLEIVPVSMMDQVLEHALVRTPHPIEWEEAAVPVKPVAPPAEDDSPGLVAH